MEFLPIKEELAIIFNMELLVFSLLFCVKIISISENGKFFFASIQFCCLEYFVHLQFRFTDKGTCISLCLQNNLGTKSPKNYLLSSSSSWSKFDYLTIFIISKESSNVNLFDVIK